MSHSYPSDISREQFARILPTLESARRRTKPRTVDLYDVFCGVLYLLKSGCQWRMLPADFPGLYSQQRHTMLVKQCQLGLGYPVAVSEAHEQAVITGHDREEFRRLTLMLLEQRGLPTGESAKNVSKRRPWV